MDDRLSQNGSIGQTLFEGSPVGVFTFDREGRVLRCNPAMVALLGAPDEKTTQLFNVLTLPTVPARIREDVIRASLNDGKARTVDFEYVSMHGKRSYLRFHFLPIFDANQEISGVVAQAVDMSAMRHLAEGLRRTSKMESLSLLAGSLAHDLNNIFTTLIGFTSLLSGSRQLSPERTAKAVDHIGKAANSGALLVEQLLNFTSERQAELSACRFQGAFKQAVTLFGYGLGPHIRFSAKEAGDPGLWVRGSLTKVEQVLLNVFLNARDALVDGRGTINVTSTLVGMPPADAVPQPADSPGGFICVTVSDNGGGIPADVLPRIFDPYFTTKEPGRGTGLGLSSVWGILQELGGCARVSSSVAVGTTFELFFPTTETKRETAGDMTPELQSLAGNGERVLVVEPDPQLSEMLVWLLLKNGYKAVAADQPDGALELLGTIGESIDAVIWDRTAAGPGLTRLLAVAGPARIPVMQLTNAGRGPLEHPHLPTVAKPFAPTRLLQVLARTLAMPPDPPA